MAYNDEIVIQEYTQAKDAYGGADDGTWSTYKTVWADLDDEVVTKMFDADMHIGENTTTFTIHAHDAPGVTTKMRISYDSQIFVIRSIRKVGRLQKVIIAEAYDDE